MIKKQLQSGAEIHSWFPKNVYINNIDEQYTLEDLKELENILKSSDCQSKRNWEFNVDSYSIEDNSKLLKNNKIKNVFNKLLEASKEFCREIGYDEAFCEKLEIVNKCFNIGKKGDYVQKHIHTDSLLSGNFFIKCNEKDGIRFYDEDLIEPPYITNDYSYTNATYNCTPGTFVLFKSSLPHSTNKQTSKEKITLSFNIVINNNK